MYTTLHCLALRSTQVSDSKLLLTAWSRELGRVTIAMPAGASREARRRRALATPLAAFEGVCDTGRRRDVLSMRDFRPMPYSLAMSPEPAKTMVAMFVGEVLDRLLRRNEADGPLSDFLFGSAQALATLTDGRAVANYHLLFLYGLTHFAGIAPDLSGWHRGAVFDMRESRFRNSVPAHPDFLIGRAVTVLMTISRSDYARASRLPVDAATRREALTLLLRYLELHLAPLDSLRSLDILRSL